MKTFDWLFRNRKTGKYTIAQPPNAPILVFLAMAVARAIFNPEGTANTVLALVGASALTVWAALEVFTGVNPFRRILGAVVSLTAFLGWLLS